MTFDRTRNSQMPTGAASRSLVARLFAVLFTAGLVLACATPARAAYWNVFNIEGEDSVDAAIVTYATRLDMLNDTNRTGLFIPDGSGGFGQNIVGSGSDGTAYWNVFNVEGENSLDAAIVTYATLADMLNDENRTGLFIPDGGGFGYNIVGSGADILAQTEIPEPGTLGLIASGLLATAYGRRRRNAAARPMSS